MIGKSMRAALVLRAACSTPSRPQSRRRPRAGAPIHNALALAARQVEDPGCSRAILTAVLVEAEEPRFDPPMPGVPPDIPRWRHPAPSSFSAAPALARETGGEFLTFAGTAGSCAQAIESVLRHAR